jgi:hypothetical protein
MEEAEAVAGAEVEEVKVEAGELEVSAELEVLVKMEAESIKADA